jgi:lipopolysaccharide transport system permease protein
MPSADLPVTRIQPSKGWVPLKLDELWEYRELLYFLTWRDIKVRYKQTALGIVWAILQPVLMMVVFTLFFGKLGKMSSDGFPYAPWSLAGLVPWTFFAYGLAQSSNSLVSSQNLLKKVYFPRLVIPISSVLSGVVDFLIAFAILLVMMPFFHLWPTVNIVWLPLLLLLAFVTSLGVGLWLSALNVEYRDIRYAIPFLTQFWMFATPIVYPSSCLDHHPLAKMLYGLNPLAGVVEGFRWALLGSYTRPGQTVPISAPAPGPMVLVSALSAILVLAAGAFYFRRMERNFADVV